MKRSHDNLTSTYGRDATVRMTRAASKTLFDHMRADSHREQMAFALGRHAKTADGTVFIVNDVILPDESDLATQSAAGVSPTTAYLTYIYRSALQSRSSIVEFHTHPGSAAPAFSGTDEFHGRRNAEYIAEKFPEPVTLVMIVGNNRFDAFDGVLYDRHRTAFRQLNRLEVLGRPSRIWSLEDRFSQTPPDHSDTFERQQRIPGWNQQALEEQRIAIIGAGGNGAPLLQTLLGIGAGRRGFLAVVDHDVVEKSNLPRLPYAYDDQVGTPKVSAATLYAARKSPSTPFYAFPCRFNEQPVLERMKMATVLFYCGDNDGGRKEANDFAIRYGIPLIDLGCDIQVSDSQVVAGGQVRTVLPGENACLVCCRGFDPAKAAIDQMGNAGRAQQAAHGYVRGADAQATPSVANLNGLTVQFALSQFLALIHGEEFAQWDYLHFDQYTGRTIPARTTRLHQCPLCGDGGRLLLADAIDDPASHQTSVTKFKAKPSEKVAPTAPTTNSKQP